MISNDEYNFLFVAITRSGSEAIRTGLSESNLSIHWNDRQPHPWIPYLHTGHFSAVEWRDALGEDDFNNRFKFTFVRNPYCKLVSHFTGACRYKQYGLRKSDQSDPNKFDKWLTKTLVEHTIAACKIKSPRAKYCNHDRSPHWNNVDWISDENGKILVDFIGRHENIDEDYKKVLKLIGTTTDILLPRVNVSNRGYGYKHYYNSDNIELVKKYYKRDIEEFGYAF